ncbi:aldehyde dehydrogenase family protein [Caballeronia sp. LZ008]|uniref:aldehyde dehydrogenase family protein n=1 Tax=Caballeronia sp. LZ008 TaxID=3038560 RepID=UPI0028588BE6|nr:aldehyde dehydrogenase family protein [Caballeronia sp. LZ008]MDR5798093.1 aldehyde dehydrogenase family protein [Caballeronia sp. LZ008]
MELGSPAHAAEVKPRAERRFDVFSPFDGALVGQAPDIECRTLEATFVEGARLARTLRSSQIIQRRLGVWAVKIEAHRDELAKLVSLETGKPIRLARIEVSAAISALHAFTLCPELPFVRDSTSAQSAFSILNWCDPVFSTVTEATTVLSSGRALVLKPSSRAPLASQAVGALWQDDNELDALFLVAPSTDAIGMFRAALMSSHVTEVRFRGSRDVAAFVAGACDEAVAPVTISTSERLPLVLHARTDAQAASDAIIGRAFLQPLLPCAERVSCLYVHDSLADSFVRALVEKMSALRVGDPLEDETDIGPVIDDVATALISEQVEEALLEGAALAGEQPLFAGRRLRPMVLDYATPSMRVCSEDVEGPVVPVIRFSHPSELPNAKYLTIDSLVSSATSGRFDCSKRN